MINNGFFKLFRTTIVNWYNDMKYKKISFCEEFITDNDDREDYVLLYKAIFEPTNDDVERARLEIWLSNDGRIGIGYEKVSRVAKRIRAKWVFGYKERFAAGHEPEKVTLTGVCALLNMVATGEIALKPVVFLGILWQTKAVMSKKNIDLLKKHGYTSVYWIKGLNECDFRNNKKLIYYKHWE